MLRSCLPILLLALILPLSGGEAAPIATGQRVLICGHSFHVYIANPLGTLAKEAGIAGHTLLESQFLPGSEVSEHWALTGGKDKVRPILKAGGVDVLTLAPAWGMPDPAIDRFVDLGCATNPTLRVFLQQSWTGFDGKQDRKLTPAQRDAMTVEELQTALDRQTPLFRQQAEVINKRLGRRVVYVAPVGQAVLALRAQVIAGAVPGITTQSQLFRDSLGHPLDEVRNLVTYVFFACIYRRSPVGMASLKSRDPRVEAILQDIAWKTVRAAPDAGVQGD